MQVNTVVAVIDESGARGNSYGRTAEDRERTCESFSSNRPAHRSGNPVSAALAASGPATEVVMPQMGESIFEGTITKWLKNVGEPVTRDEPLFEISTDKVDAEIPAPVSGVLTADQGRDRHRPCR